MIERNVTEALVNDFYQFTTGAAYMNAEKQDEVATYDYFVRGLPENWGYLLACGIDNALEYIQNLQYSEEDVRFLGELAPFKLQFLDYLRDFKFSGNVHALEDGTPRGENTPIMRVTARRIEAQIIETRLLNILNFQTLVGSKASRIVRAAAGKSVMEFGLRRAHEMDAGTFGARASYIAGFDATSNVYAGAVFGIPVRGTFPHAYVTSFDSELEAFRNFTATFPNAVLLIDTYDIMRGAENAAIVAKELEARGQRLFGTRTDSGDLATDSRAVLDYFKSQRLEYLSQVASNDLDEYRIAHLGKEGAFGSYGVGTRNIVGHPGAALSGVYKLVEDNHGPKIKLSEGKQTLPGIKQVYRHEDANGHYLFDTIGLPSEDFAAKALLTPAIVGGEMVREQISLAEVRRRSLAEVERLPERVRELEVRSPYKSVVSDGVAELIEITKAKYLAQRRVA